ncbi:MAG TPA: 30S ribosomal protein S6 [Opitutales bacterium]|jgi:small subunit ribosomal protein S6|nr:30S ribosomal protein S6 [Opitutales bacterium]
MSKSANRTYTATFLLDTRGYTEPVDTLVAKLRDSIIAVQGEVTKVENHGQRDFQRPPSRSYPNGIFVTFTFTAPLTAPAALREKMRLDPNVNRIMVQSA